LDERICADLNRFQGPFDAILAKCKGASSSSGQVRGDPSVYSLTWSHSQLTTGPGGWFEFVFVFWMFILLSFWQDIRVASMHLIDHSRKQLTFPTTNEYWFAIWSSNLIHLLRMIDTKIRSNTAWLQIQGKGLCNLKV
jgi:hypothetical protein